MRNSGTRDNSIAAGSLPVRRFTIRIKPFAGITVPATSQEWHLVSLTADGSTTTVDLVGVFAAGQFTSQTDCFSSGTVATRP